MKPLERLTTQFSEGNPLFLLPADGIRPCRDCLLMCKWWGNRCWSVARLELVILRRPIGIESLGGCATWVYT